MNKQYHVRLTPEERAHLFEVIGRGSCPARKQTRARLLLKLDEGEEGPAWPDLRAAEAMEVCEATAARLRRKFDKKGLEKTARAARSRIASTTVRWTGSTRRT